MLPKWHILYGVIFSLLVYFLFNISFFEGILIFLSSIFIDFDHYLWYIYTKKDSSLKNAYNYLKNLRRNKPFLMIFHTVEFLLIFCFLSCVWKGFLFILIGILFHSILDLIYLAYEKKLNQGEFSLIKYFIKNAKKR